MSEFLQQLLNGLSLGAIYALIALGYTMVYGVLQLINFAHSEVFMFGTFAVAWAFIFFHGTDDPYLSYTGGYGPKVASLPSPDGKGTLGNALPTAGDDAHDAGYAPNNNQQREKRR